jgi:hypothetical protein
MNQDLFHEYEKFLTYDQQKLATLKKQIRQLALFRFLAFVGIILSLIYLPKVSGWIAYPLATAGTILFFYWIKVFLKKEKEKKLFTNLVDINQKELLALGEEYSQFESGKEFIDPHHHFTFDLDIFGPGSLFQFINRTVTQLGKKKLAAFLGQPERDITTLQERQAALVDLAKHTRWRQFFAAKGHSHDEEDFFLLQKITQKSTIQNPKTIKRLLIILPILSSVSFLVCQFTTIPWALFILSLVINGGVLVYHRKTIQSFYKLFGSQSKLLARYQELLILIEDKEFSSPRLKELQNKLSCENKKASTLIDKLQRTMARFDYRQNIIVGLALNAILLWDLRCSYQLYQWQAHYKNSINLWFDVIAEFDALSSFANLNHNHPEWTIPKFEDGEFHVTANDLKHPLIKSAKCIGNDFRQNGLGQIAIITGANMAGKSTFLRTIGVNMILAMNGCRVNASWLSLKPIQLFTNMRTTDNLQNDESYFFAELLRLKAILDEIKSGQEVFVIIDEMLKGTNSEDKLSGSIKLIEQLISLNAVGIVATHDLKLTSLAEKYSKNVSNKCFEIQLNNDELIFDYKLTDGVTSTMNANFLMKKMGIIPN